jgi:hypothetical protein
MSAARAAYAVLVLAAVLRATPAHAQSGPRRLVVYPVAAAGSARADVADVVALLDPALRRVALRTEEVVLGEPLVVRPGCGPAPAAATACLAGLAGGGLVLRVTVHRSQSLIVVQLEAIDAKARAFGPMTVSIDAYAQSTEPVVRGVLILVDQVAAASRRPDLRAGGSLPPPPVPGATAAARPAPAPFSALPGAPSETPSRPGAWMRTAGPLLTGTGVAILAGGIALSVVNRSLSNELEHKFAAGTLTPADLAAYRRVERNDRMTQLLLGAGGALTLSGVAVWTAAPAKGAVAGVAGKF